MKGFVKRILCFALTLAMVFTMMPTIAKAEENGRRLYFELPAGTNCSDWAVNVWGNGISVDGNSSVMFRPNTWGDGDWYPTLLESEYDGWGYVTVFGSVDGMQFVNRNAYEYKCWNSQIAAQNVEKAFFSPSTGKWYKETSKVHEIIENAPLDTFGVAGDDRLVAGGWDINNTTTMIRSDENENVFSITFENVEPGTYKYKILQDPANKKWDIPWGNNDDRSLTVREKSDVTLSIDLTDSTKNVEVKTVPASTDDSGEEGIEGDKEETGETIDETTDEGAMSATLVGNFWGIEFIDDAGNRYDLDNWEPTDEDGDLKYIGNGIYKRTFKFIQLSEAITLAGDGKGYKVAFNHKWDYSLGDNGQNIALTIPAGASEWTIIVDEKNKVVYDNFRAVPFITHHNNGVTIERNPFDTTVSLVGSMNAWKASVGSGYDFELISDSLYRFDTVLDAGIYGYKVKFNGTDWYENGGDHTLGVADNGTKVVFVYSAKDDEIYDSINNADKLNALLGTDEFEASETPVVVERIPCVPGTFPGPSWDPASNKMTKLENVIYSYTFENVPAGNYEYKIAFGSWGENYGASGYKDGANIAVRVPTSQDVTIYYSDSSHLSVNSIDYKFVNVYVEFPDGTKIDLKDYDLYGIYTGKVSLKAGEYDGVKIVADEKVKDIEKFSISEDKEVTFNYDPTFEICYNDATSVPDDWQWNKIKFDSKDSYFKEPFGAVRVGEDVKFTLVTGTDITAASLVIKDNAAKTIELINVTDEDDNDKKVWSVTTKFDEIGQCQYYFTVSVGGFIKIYADDPKGDYGTGMVADFFDIYRPEICKPYDLSICTTDYKTPDWMKNAVIYQIFPDRFANGDISNDKAQTSSRGATDYEFPEWDMIPENPEQEDKLSKEEYEKTGAFYGDRNWSNEMYGGDFAGIIENIDYLKALGVNVIYLNPVFSSISSHRYDATDYSKIDPILGTLGDFEELVKVAEKNDMKIVLDGVFNHVSDDSIYFDRYYKFLTAKDFDGKMGAYPYWAYVYDYMKENNASKEDAEAKAKEYFTAKYKVNDFSYTTWFAVYDSYMSDGKDGNVCDTIGLREGKPVYGYEGWWGYDSMPVIKSTNGSEYQTEDWAKTIIGKADDNGSYDNNGSIAQYWLSEGSNGWRLDVANEVSDETWQNFRKSVKAMQSDAVIIGEIWDDATRYLLGDMYDSVMNYVFRNAVMGFAKGGNASDAMATLERMRERYPKEAFYAMMNLVDSHDTSRVLSYLDGVDDDRKQKDIDKAFPTYERTSDEAKAKQYLAAFLQFTYPGAPTIYYGDELGVVGADDPDDRRTIPWGKGNEELVTYYAKLSAIRHAYPALSTGDIKPLYFANNENVLGFVRSDDKDTLVVLANNKADEITISINVKELGLEGEVKDLISGKEYEETETIEVTIAARTGAILTVNPKEIVIEDAIRAAYDPEFVHAKTPEETTPSSGNESSERGNAEGNNTSNESTATAPATAPAHTEVAGRVTPLAPATRTADASLQIAEDEVPLAVNPSTEEKESVIEAEKEQTDASISETDTKEAEKELATVEEDEVPMAETVSEESASFIWLWILLGVAVCGLIGYVVYQAKKSEKEN